MPVRFWTIWPGQDSSGWLRGFIVKITLAMQCAIDASKN